MNAKYIVLILLISASSCTRRDPAVDVTPVLSSVPFIFYQNVVYGADPNEQDLDVDLPLVRDTINTPVVILIHGGGWEAGSKADFYGLGLDTFFTANGCAVVDMNYRLDGNSYNGVNYAYPDCLDDVGHVMNFLKQKAAEWQINPNRVCMLGKSSGAHLALLYAYSLNAGGRVKAVIDGFGPTDFCDSTVVDAALAGLVTGMLGPYASNMQAWHNASPIFYLAGAVPTAIMQGTSDTLVYPIQSFMLEDSLLTRGIPCQFYPWVGDYHGWDQTKWMECRKPILSWLKNYL